MDFLKDHQQKLIGAGAAAMLLAHVAYFYNQSRAPLPPAATTPSPAPISGIPPEDRYHLALETGGTSCKVGIMKDASSLKILRS